MRPTGRAARQADGTFPRVTSGVDDVSRVYAPPREVAGPDDCSFYHTMDLPGWGLVEGPWDLRSGVDAYLGNIDVRGKRVLELGAADGYLSFHMERRGAEVVSYDLSEHDRWDIVPYARLNPTSTGPGSEVGAPDGDGSGFVPAPPSWVADADEEHRWAMRRLNNAYWLAHRAFGSRARLVHGTVYSVPAEIGPVDVSVFGALLLHTRDPFAALVPSLRLTRHTVVVTDALGLVHLPRVLRRARELLPRQLRRPLMRFMPDWRSSASPDGWWRLTPEIVQEFLGVLGFERTEVSAHTQLFNGKRKRLFTVVGHRTRGGP